MCLKMKAQLDAWAADDTISSVAIQGAGERAFCAGGDVRALYESGKAKTPYALDFWRDEYILNAAIKHFPKPYIAFLKGIVMGGGVGVSIHGSHRVADESVTFAMPETGIGLFPDVGGSYFLPRIKGEIGLYMGLTGARLKAADCLYTGLATHVVPAANTDAVIDKLASGATPDRAISGLAADAGTAPLIEPSADIQRLFAAEGVEGILSGLEADNSEWSRKTAKILRTKSPTSLKIAYRQIREGAKLEFDDCMRMEFRIVSRIIEGHDFFEGVRADDHRQGRRAEMATGGTVRRHGCGYRCLFRAAGRQGTEARVAARQEETMTTIGFIGVGNMGGPMARNLVKAGHDVKAFDLSAPALNAAVETGATAAASAAEAATGVDVVITMLPAGQHVRSVYLDDGGVLAVAKRGALLIDCSTIDIDSARAVAAAADKAGFQFLDTPVSGGVGGAEAGTLTFMCGGSEDGFARAKPVLDAMGKKIVLAGGAGAGQAAKVCNNMLLAISMIGTCEAFTLGEKLGLDPQKLFDIVSTSSGQCWSVTTYCPVAGSSADFSCEQRLCRRLRHGTDAEGSEAGAGGGAIGGRYHAAWRRSAATLFAVREQRACRRRFLRHRQNAARRGVRLQLRNFAKSSSGARSATIALTGASGSR